MKKSDLKRYIEKEISIVESMQLSEAAGDMELSQFQNILNSFKNVFKVTGVALKSVLSVISLNIEIVFTHDYKEAFNKYNSRSSFIQSEYKSLLADFEKRFEDYKPLLFLMDPGKYLAYEILDDTGTNFEGVRTFLKNTIGLDVTNIIDVPGLDAASKALANALSGNDPSQSSKKSASNEIIRRQRNLEMKLNRLFGMSSRMSEGKLNEETKVQVDPSLIWSFNQVLPHLNNEAFGIKKDTIKKIEKLKSDQVNDFVNTLNIPVKFLDSLGKAKNIDEIKESLLIIKNSPFKISGFEKLNKEAIDSATKNAIKTAKKKGNLDKLLKELNVNDSASNEEKFEAIKAFQMKNAIGNAFISASKEISKTVEDARQRFIDELTKDMPIESVKEIAPGSNLEKILTEGVKKIENAGKRQQKK